jgi:hypothetical protein
MHVEMENASKHSNLRSYRQNQLLSINHMLVDVYTTLRPVEGVWINIAIWGISFERTDRLVSLYTVHRWNFQMKFQNNFQNGNLYTFLDLPEAEGIVTIEFLATAPV